MKSRLQMILGMPAVLLLSGLLGSCGPQRWTEAQKANLSAVSLRQTGVAPKAYHEPDAANPPGASGSVPAATGGGAIPALIGLAVDAGVSKVQQSKFDKTEGHHASASQRNIPGDLAPRFSGKLERSLKKNHFFKDRLKQGATASIQPTLLSYGYKRVSETEDGAILMSPVLQVEMTVTDAKGTSLLKQTVVSPGMSPAPLRDYATNPAKARAAFEKEMDQTVAEIEAIWIQKLGH